MRTVQHTRSARDEREKRNAATASAASGRPLSFPKYVALGDTAGVASANGRSQRGKLRFLPLHTNV